MSLCRQTPTPPAVESAYYTEPTYNLSDVRAALRLLRTELAHEGGLDEDPDSAAAEPLNASFCAVLSTLVKIAANVMRIPVNPQHLTINLLSPAVAKKFGRYTGARQLLAFCGFNEVRADASADAPASHALTLPLASVDQCRTRIERALVILGKVKHEHSPAPSMDAPTGGTSAAAAAAEQDEPMHDAAAPSSVFLANVEGVHPDRQRRAACGAHGRGRDGAAEYDEGREEEGPSAHGRPALARARVDGRGREADADVDMSQLGGVGTRCTQNSMTHSACIADPLVMRACVSLSAR